MLLHSVCQYEAKLYLHLLRNFGSGYHQRSILKTRRNSGSSGNSAFISFRTKSLFLRVPSRYDTCVVASFHGKMAGIEQHVLEAFRVTVAESCMDRSRCEENKQQLVL